MKALILAAGLGTRLAPITNDRPKSLVAVNGQPILLKQIANLYENGVTDITIVSGYKSEIIEKVVHENFPKTKIIKSINYASTNNMYSAYIARDIIGYNEYLMMNADVFFDASVIKALLSYDAPNAIATDIGEYLEESMKVVERDGGIVKISKEIRPEDALGVSIDLYKFSAEGGQAFFAKCAEYIEDMEQLTLWSEVALNDILSEVRFQACPVKGRWLEIDNHDDLAAAEKLFAERTDYFGNDVKKLKSKKLFLFDMDGTIYNEKTVFDGTHQLLNHINSISGKYIFVTNNSSKSVVDYNENINRLGIDAAGDNFFTSIEATILYLKKNYAYAKVYCQGTKSLVNTLEREGIDVTEKMEKVDVVLVGFDTELTSQKLRNTCEILLTQNVDFIATNPDLRCPVSFGFIPDCGSICAMISNATSKKPQYIGKPEPIMIEAVREKYNYKPEETVIIGDRLYTDIATGLNAGVDTICVLTGEATVEEIKRSVIKPTYTFYSVKEIWESLK